MLSYTSGQACFQQIALAAPSYNLHVFQQHRDNNVMAVISSHIQLQIHISLWRDYYSLGYSHAALALDVHGTTTVLIVEWVNNYLNMQSMALLTVSISIRDDLKLFWPKGMRIIRVPWGTSAPIQNSIACIFTGIMRAHDIMACHFAS